jgi:hypothetical protein
MNRRCWSRLPLFGLTLVLTGTLTQCRQPPEQQQSALTLQISGQGSVTLDPPAATYSAADGPQTVTYDAGVDVTLTVTPQSGWSFDHWEGDLTGSDNPATLTMDADKQVTAVLVSAGGGAGVIMGKVSSVDGEPLAGVAVSLASGASASADDYGFFSFAVSAESSGAVVAHFEKAGFAPTSKSLTVQSSATASPVAIHMASEGETFTIDSDAESTQRTAMSAVTIPGHALVNAAGEAVTGEVDLTITHLDPSTDAVLAFPGTFSGARAADGASAAIESFGFASYKLTQGGAPVNLAPGESATVEYILPDNAQGHFQPGDTIGLWEFDEQTAMWQEAGEGTVQTASDGSGQLAWVAQVTHFSDWNCDQKEERHCITGRVLTDAPFEGSDLAPLVPRPLEGAEVTARGIDYNGTDTALTGPDGRFCVYAKAGSQARIEIRANGSARPVTYHVNGQAIPFEANIVNVPDSGADCGGAECVDMGDLQILLDSYVKGTVQYNNGSPAAGIRVHAVPGATALTDASGNFCVKCVGDMDVQVYADGWSAVSVSTTSGASCDNAAEASLNIALPKPGDEVGQVTVGKSLGYIAVPGLTGAQALTTFHLSAAFLVWDNSRDQSVSFPGMTVTVEDLAPCRVTTTDSTFTSGDLTAPENTGVGALDPGSPGTASNGTDTVELLRGEATPDQPWMAGYFSPPEGADLLALGFDAGQTISFQFPGGADLGAFSGSVTVPADLAVTSPDLADGNLVLDLTAPLDLMWAAGDPSDTVVVSLYAFRSQNTENPDGTMTATMHSVSVECELPDVGSGSVSADLMARLPADSMSFYLDISRTHTVSIAVPLKRVSGTGVVRLVGQASVTRTWFNVGP